MKNALTFLMFLILAGPFAGAEDMPYERMNRTFQVFSKALDSLLLDTAHVFVQKGDDVQSVYLEGIGVVFTGNISITGSGKFSIAIQGWQQWFEGNDKKDESGDEKEKGKPNSYETIIERDKERMEQMEEHLTAFKNELIMTTMDFGSILKGIDKDEEIIIIFHVREEQFSKKYDSSALTLRITYKDLLSINDKSPESRDVLEKFRVNI